MTKFICIETGEYPLTEQDIRFRNPNTSFTQPFICPEGFSVVFPAPAPSYNPDIEQAIEISPVQTSKGHWEQQWSIQDRFATAEELTEYLDSKLQQAKQTKRNEINAARLKANFTSFTHGGKEIACDTLSRSDIDAVNGIVALTGALPSEWPGAWKAMDNTYVPITTVNHWKAFFGAMVAKGQENFAKAQSLKALIEAATTVQEVQSITW